MPGRAGALERELAARVLGARRAGIAAEAGVAVRRRGDRRPPRRRPPATGSAASRRRARRATSSTVRPWAIISSRRRHVDPVVAGVLDRRRGDPQVDLGGARVAQHLHDLPGRVAAHDRVVDDDQPLAGDDLGQRVELQPQAVAAQLLAGLDEGPRDVAVLDEAVVLGQARRRARARGRRRCRSRARGSRGRPRPAPRATGSRPSAPRATCSTVPAIRESGRAK